MGPRRSLGIVLIAGLFAAGCGVGVKAETNKEHATPYLANASIGSIAIRAVRIVIADNAAGSASAPQAYLLATLVNSSDTPDTLTSATIAGGAAEGDGGSSVNVTVPAQQVVSLGEPDLALPGPTLAVGALQTALTAGTAQQVTFTFATAGTTVLTAPVLASDDVGTTASAAPVSASG